MLTLTWFRVENLSENHFDLITNLTDGEYLKKFKNNTQIYFHFDLCKHKTEMGDSKL